MSKQLEIIIRRHRIVPRLVLAFASVLLYKLFNVSVEIMQRDDISSNEVALAIGVLGAFGSIFTAIVKFYQESGGNEKDIKSEKTT